MAKQIKQIKYILLALVIAIISCGFGGYVVASASTVIDYSRTSVEYDLGSATVDGVPFKFENYPADANGVERIISFQEYGYSTYEDEQDYYGLYFYFYNPKQKAINIDSASNRVAFAVGYTGGQIEDMGTFEIECIDFSEQYLIYKFKVKDASSIKERIDSGYNGSTPDAWVVRSYDVSAVYLMLDNSNTATALSVGGSYHFKGFASGMNNTYMSTLECLTNDLTTIELDLHSTSFKSPVYDIVDDINYQHHIHSVYFDIPNSYLQNDALLYGIKAEWFEFETTPMLVTNDKNLYDEIMPLMGVDIGYGTENFSYQLFNKFSQQTASNNLSFTSTYTKSYNIEPGTYVVNHGNEINSSYTTSHTAVVKDELTKLSYAFYSDEENLIDMEVSASEVEDYIYGYNSPTNAPNYSVNGGNLSTDLLIGTNEKTSKYISVDDAFSLPNYNSENSAWDKLVFAFWNGGMFDGYDAVLGDNGKITPIQPLSSDNFEKINTELSYELCVTENDLTKLSTHVKFAEAFNKTTHIFRFATTDYKTYEMQSTDNAFFGADRKTVGYIAEQTAFMDFNIIYLTFLEDGVYTNIPVVANPLNIIDGLTYPDLSADDGMPWWVWLIIIAIGIVIALIIICCLLPHVISLIFSVLWGAVKLVFKLLVYVITLPFRAIAGIIRLIKGG